MMMMIMSSVVELRKHVRVQLDFDENEGESLNHLNESIPVMFVLYSNEVRPLLARCAFVGTRDR